MYLKWFFKDIIRKLCNKNIFLLLTHILIFQVPGSTSDSVKVGSDLLETAMSKLELTGVGGSPTAVRLRCEASVFRLYRANSVEVEVRPESPQPASVLLLETSNKPSSGKLPYLYLQNKQNEARKFE